MPPVLEKWAVPTPSSSTPGASLGASPTHGGPSRTFHQLAEGQQSGHLLCKGGAPEPQGQPCWAGSTRHSSDTPRKAGGEGRARLPARQTTNGLPCRSGWSSESPAPHL